MTNPSPFHMPLHRAVSSHAAISAPLSLLWRPKALFHIIRFPLPPPVSTLFSWHSSSNSTIRTVAKKIDAGYGYKRAFSSGARRAGSSSERWKDRQWSDSYRKDARVMGLKSRAAFKLLEIDSKHKIFKKGQTVVDLGYAPGSWCQVAVERTKPDGRIVGIDMIPAQPPKGVSTIQGNFLSIPVQEEVKRFLSDPNRGRPHNKTIYSSASELQLATVEANSYVEEGRRKAEVEAEQGKAEAARKDKEAERAEQASSEAKNKSVDVVLSDMMMNTSGINFADHAGSMDLCNAALSFAYDTLRPDGHFICKFYQGSEDKDLEKRLKKLFATVHREKPESSRSESKEAYFVALRRKLGVDRAAVVVNE